MGDLQALRAWLADGGFSTQGNFNNDIGVPPTSSWRSTKKLSLFQPACVAGMPLCSTLNIDKALYALIMWASRTGPSGRLCSGVSATWRT